MARICHVCGKKPMAGNRISKSRNHTKRRWLPNLQRVRIQTQIGRQSRRSQTCARLCEVYSIRKNCQGCFRRAKSGVTTAARCYASRLTRLTPFKGRIFPITSSSCSTPVTSRVNRLETLPSTPLLPLPAPKDPDCMFTPHWATALPISPIMPGESSHSTAMRAI